MMVIVQNQYRSISTERKNYIKTKIIVLKDKITDFYIYLNIDECEH
jgi:hypothetical protein